MAVATADWTYSLYSRVFKSDPLLINQQLGWKPGFMDKLPFQHEVYSQKKLLRFEQKNHESNKLIEFFRPNRFYLLEKIQN